MGVIVVMSGPEGYVCKSVVGQSTEPFVVLLWDLHRASWDVLQATAVA